MPARLINIKYIIIRAEKVASPATALQAGWIKMTLGVEVGLGPGHIVVDGDPALLPKKGQSPLSFRPISIVAKRLDASKCHLV